MNLFIDINCWVSIAERVYWQMDSAKLLTYKYTHLLSTRADWGTYFKILRGVFMIFLRNFVHMATIVHINTVAHHANSVGRLMQALVAHERASGARVFVVAGYGSRNDADWVMESRAAYIANVAIARLSDNDGFGASRATRRMTRWLEAVSPDVVHIHNLHGYYINMPMLVETLKRLRSRVVVTLHDSWLMTGHCASPCRRYDADNGCLGCDAGFRNRYPASYVRCDVARRREYKLSMMRALKDRLTVVAPSPVMQRRFIAALPGAMCQTIPHGTDIGSDIYSGAAKPKDGRIHVLAVAFKWTFNKNPEALIKLAEAMPDDFELTIVGSVSGGLPERINHIPSVKDRNELVKLYKMSHVLVSASHSESFGMTVAESITLGTPVVVNRGSGADEIISPADGVVCDCNDTGSLIKAIRKAIVLTPETTYDIANMLRAYHEHVYSL